MRKINANIAVILGMSANGLSVLRSLGRKGIEIFGVDSDLRNPGMYSRYCKKIICPDVINDEKAFLSFLIKLGRSLPCKGVLFATADEYITVISKRRQDLFPYFYFLYPSHDLVETFLNKKKQLDWQSVLEFYILILLLLMMKSI